MSTLSVLGASLLLLYAMATLVSAPPAAKIRSCSHDLFSAASRSCDNGLASPLRLWHKLGLATLPCGRPLLVESLDNLLNLYDTLFFTSGCSDVLEGVRWLYKHRIVDDNLVLCPSCREPVFAWLAIVSMS